ncbi:phage tail protein [Mariprofundus ferrooxydans]|uniref:phage tail protein n=1 Tax=Mariprofundus ferrooxydans TaxID=314344 RepID=UPI00142F851C|nr:phage tail protein [Mariprofundus ferrooxydans]
MRVATTAMATALARTDGAAFRILVEITPPGGSVRRLCADAQTVSGNAYDAELVSIGQMYESLTGAGDLSLSVLDSAANRTACRVAADAKVKLWALGTALSDAITLIWGSVDDPWKRAGGRISFDVISRATLHDRNITRLLSATDFPGADPAAIGRTMPVIYGSHTASPCLGIDAGSITTLQLATTATAVTLSVSDASKFPASGTIQIDDEQITYTSKNPTTILGCTRGANGTTAVAHDKGATVAEVQTQYDYLVADHPVKAISAVYVAGVKQQGADFAVLLDDAGQAKVRFTTLPKLTKQVNLAVNDTIAVNDAITVSDNIAIASANPNYARETLGCDAPIGTQFNSAMAYQTFGFSTMTQVGVTEWEVDLSSLGLSASFYGGYGWVYLDVWVGNPSGRTYMPGHAYYYDSSGVYTNNLSKIRFHWSPVGGQTQPLLYMQAGAVASAGATASLTVTIGQALSMDALYIEPIVNTKTGAASRSGSVSKTGTVALSGNSVADTVIGGQVTVDVQGWADDASGTITGTANALIEQPDHVARHIISHYGGATAAEAAAADFTAFTGDVLTAVLDQHTKVRDMLTRISEQCRAIICYSGDRWIMRKRPDPGATPVVVLADADVVRTDSGASTLTESKSGTRNLVNHINYRCGLSASRAGWAASGQLDNAASQASYGLRDRIISMPDVPTEAQALTTLNWQLLRTANPDRMLAGCSLTLAHLLLEVGDVVGINHVKMSMVVTGEVTGIGPRPLSGKQFGTFPLSIEEL